MHPPDQAISRRDGARAPVLRAIHTSVWSDASAGRQSPWEPEIPYRTSRARSSFNGVHVRVVAVYHRTVDELMALPGRLWLVFAPVARDASVTTVERAVASVQRRTRTRDELADLLATMTIVAESRGATDAIQEKLMKAMDDQGVTFSSKL